jgi:hypothetical protein
MNETSEEPTLWDLEEHLNGCLAAYQIERSFGAAVALAFEALRGIARDVQIRARAGCFPPAQLDEQWILSPKETVPVPWIWIRALSTAYQPVSLRLLHRPHPGQDRGSPPNLTRLRLLDNNHNLYF